MIRILLLGGAGFIGKNFIISQNKKYKIFLLLKNTLKNRNFLKDKKNIRFKKIYFNKYSEIDNKLRNIKFSIVLNLATYYSQKSDYKNTLKIIDSNIVFPSVIMSLMKPSNIKKIINIGTTFEHKNNQKYYPANFYASCKHAFQKIIQFYNEEFYKTKFYNLKFYETYGLNDKRDKIIQNIKNCFYKKKIFKLYSKKLKLNFLHVEDVISALNILITENIRSGEYLIKSKKHSYVYKLLDLFNKTNKKKINYKISNKKTTKYDYKIKKPPKWKQKYFIENDFQKLITNENN